MEVDHTGVNIPTRIERHHINSEMSGTTTEDSLKEGTNQTIHTEAAVQSLDGEKVEKIIDDGHLIQIKAFNSEIERRISAFIERKQHEVDENNRQEFCSVFPSVEVSEESCARTEAVFVPRAGGKSHIKVTRVVNSYGPQTRALGLGQDVSPSKPQVIKQESNTEGIDERLRNIETHLKMKGSSKTDVFSRLKVLEERVLFLESLSPEYFKSGPPAHKRQRTSTVSTSSQDYKEMSLSEIEEKMRSLRDSLRKKAADA